MTYPLSFIGVDVILSLLVPCFVFHTLVSKNVIRKFIIYCTIITRNCYAFTWLTSPLFRFDGTSFKTEASSTFPHHYVTSLGSYRKSPFVTGHEAWSDGYPDSTNSTNSVKTEILDYSLGRWEQVADYPFSDGNSL